jgi:hypothetical protein
LPQDNILEDKDRQFALIDSAESESNEDAPIGNFRAKTNSESDRSDLKFFIPPLVIENLDDSFNQEIVIPKQEE